MKAVFADTSYFVALLNARDAHHGRAVELSKSMRKVITTHFVLLEVFNSFSDPAGRGLAINLLSSIDVSSAYIIVPATSTWFDRGIHLYRIRFDKSWSLTDCISFEVMTEHKLTHALTADHHFEQAGFVRMMT